MPLIPDIAVFQRKLATLPLASYQAGETVLSAASTTGQLLILNEGKVAVVKEGVEIARVTEPGAASGELAVLLDQPHTADGPRLDALPVVSHRAGETVLSAGSKTGELLILRGGDVEVVKDGVEIASVKAPGAVFGEQAVLLDQPHTADVRTLEQSEFYVADAPAILAGDPTVALYVAAILARRLDASNRWLVAGKRQLQTGEPPSVIGKALEKGEELLSYGGREPML